MLTFWGGLLATHYFTDHMIQSTYIVAFIFAHTVYHRFTGHPNGPDYGVHSGLVDQPTRTGVFDIQDLVYDELGQRTGILSGPKMINYKINAKPQFLFDYQHFFVVFEL